MISWLVPVRDASTVGEAVASAVAECAPDHEVVVVDDGSAVPVGSAGCPLPQDRRVRVLRQEATGIVAALNRGLAACRGAWIARLDADDVALGGRIAAQLAAVRASRAVIGGRAVALGPVGPGMLRHIAWVNGCDPHAELLVEAPVFHPGVLLRAEAVRALDGWRDFDGPEDYDLWLRLVAAGWEIHNVPTDVVAVRDRAERLTRTDRRYRPEAHRRLKQAWLAPRLPSRVHVWGAGKGGTPWLRWLVERGVEVPCAFDVHAGGRRHGVPIRAREEVREEEIDVLLVAVGAVGARAEIRAMLHTWRPDLVEGRDWWAVT